jgi:hypothetical protein
MFGIDAGDGGLCQGGEGDGAQVRVTPEAVWGGGDTPVNAGAEAAPDNAEEAGRYVGDGYALPLEEVGCSSVEERERAVAEPEVVSSGFEPVEQRGVLISEASGAINAGKERFSDC